MITFAAGAAVGWLVTGLADYFATRRAYARAAAIGYERGQDDALKQVSGW